MVREGRWQYLLWGEEECPETGKQHLQWWGVLKNKIVLNAKNKKLLGSEFGETHVHVEACVADIAANDAYCKKGGVWHEEGTRPAGMGARTDLVTLRDRVLAGETVDDVCMEDPMLFHQYGRTLERMREIYLRSQARDFMTEGVWLTGPTGAGKTHWAMDKYSHTTHYVKCLDDQWWDGYTGQETVILNEFRGQLKFSELLDLVDKYPKTVKQRNKGPVPFLAKKVIVTSIMKPRECYKNLEEQDTWDQFDRRFKVIEMKKRVRGPMDEALEN